jgi:predicted RNase H-like HicB family nuclease
VLPTPGGSARAGQTIAGFNAAWADMPQGMAEASYKTQAQLQAIADKAKSVYDYMLSSGKYTAAALAAAFEASADAQIVALGEVGAVDYKAQLSRAASGLGQMLTGMQGGATALAQKTFIALQMAAGSTREAAEAAAKDIVGVFLTTQAQATGLGAAVAGTFAEMISRGSTFAEALAALKDPIAVMEQQLNAKGFSGGSAFNLISSMARVAGDAITGPLVNGITGADSALRGLHNSNILTEDSFAAIALTGTQAYQSIIATLPADDINGKMAALTMMQPELQTIWKLQKDHNWAVDEGTQALINQAVEQGIVGDNAMTDAEKQTKALQTIADKMDILVGFFEKLFPSAVKQGFDKAADEAAILAGKLDKLPKEIIIPITFPTDPIPKDKGGGDDGGDRDHGYAGGTGGFRNFGSGTRTTLHGWEAVIRPQDVTPERAGSGDGGYLPVAINVDGDTLVQTMVRVGKRNGWN